MTTFLVFIPKSEKASPTGIHTVVITDTDISGSQDPCMLPVIPCLVGTPINLTGGRITTVTGLYSSIFYFMNRTTGWWSALFLPFLNVLPRILLLVYSPRHCSPTIMWI